MGLGFTIHTKIKDIEKFQQTVESQAVESGYNAEHDESSSMVSFCRLGDLFLNYQHEGEGNADNVISVNGAWYTAGYPHSSRLRAEVNTVESIEQLEELLYKEKLQN